MNICAVVLHGKEPNGHEWVTFLFSIFRDRFPNDPAARKRWTDALQRSDNWLPTKWSVVCSLHFRAEDFKAATGNLRRLTASAVPSLSLASAVSSICVHAN